MSCMILFVWHQSICQERVESEKIQNEKFLLTVVGVPLDSNQRPWDLKSDASPTELARLVDSCLFKDLITYMYFQY